MRTAVYDDRYLEYFLTHRAKELLGHLFIHLVITSSSILQLSKLDTVQLKIDKINGHFPVNAHLTKLCLDS